MTRHSENIANKAQPANFGQSTKDGFKKAQQPLGGTTDLFMMKSKGRKALRPRSESMPPMEAIRPDFNNDQVINNGLPEMVDDDDDIISQANSLLSAPQPQIIRANSL